MTCEPTIDYVNSVVAAIKENANDDEAAHCMEDALWQEVLEFVASGAVNAPELAKAALATTELDFARWCA